MKIIKTRLDVDKLLEKLLDWKNEVSKCLKRSKKMNILNTYRGKAIE